MSEQPEIDRIAEAVRHAVAERRAQRFSAAGRRARGRPVKKFSLPAAVVDALEARCGRTGETESSVVEQALKQFLETA